MLEAVSLGDVIGKNVKEIRLERDWTQDRLATHLRAKVGLAWTQPIVGAVETARRDLSAGEFLLLASGLDVSPQRLLATKAKRVAVESAEVAGRSLPDLLFGSASVKVRVTFRQLLDVAEEWKARVERAGVTLDGEALYEIQECSKRATERKAARRLGLEPEQVAALALKLWKHGMEEERDRRASPVAAKQARAYVTRSLVEEIKAAAIEVGWMEEG